MTDNVPWFVWYLYGTGVTALMIETGYTTTEAVMMMVIVGVVWVVGDWLLDKAIDRWSV